MKQFRYDYLRGPWKQTKGTCPLCNGKHKLRYFCDTHTGERLPEHIAECDKPGCYSRKPYDMQPSGLSYADEVYQRGKEEARNNPDFKLLSRPTPKPPKPLALLPFDLVQQSQRGYERNTFVQLLRRVFGWGIADELVERFCIGSSSFYQNGTVFWLFDPQGRVRGGQVVSFQEDGHTAKQLLPDGTTRRLTNWVHRACEVKYSKTGQPQPQWLQDYLAAASFSSCLFGLNQLATADPEKPIAIVESPKGMIIGAGFMPDFIWMATGSMGQLTLDRLLPLRSRKIHLYPDCHETGLAYAKWKAKADELNTMGFSITVDSYENLATEQQRKDGWDLADFILEGWEQYQFPPSWGIGP